MSWCLAVTSGRLSGQPSSLGQPGPREPFLSGPEVTQVAAILQAGTKQPLPLPWTIPTVQETPFWGSPSRTADLAPQSVEARTPAPFTKSVKTPGLPYAANSIPASSWQPGGIIRCGGHHAATTGLIPLEHMTLAPHWLFSLSPHKPTARISF